MTILRDVAAELWKMFLADARLSFSILVLVGLTAIASGFSALLAGVLLVIGMPVVLIAVVVRAARS